MPIPDKNHEGVPGDQEAARAPYILRLYVSGFTPRSTGAIANLHALCDQYLDGRYQLEIYDLYQQPELARSANLIAAPTLVKERPLPVKRLIGDLSDKQRMLACLDLASGSSFAPSDVP